MQKLISYVRAHHVGVLACVLALSGTAYAGNKIRAADIGKHQVTAPKLAKARQVTASKTFVDPAADGTLTFGSAVAKCRKGERALNGGGSVVGTPPEGLALVGSTPSRKPGWSVNASSDSGGTFVVQVTVTCLRAK